MNVQPKTYDDRHDGSFHFHASAERQASRGLDDLLEPLLDLLTISVILTDGEGRILYANMRAAALLAQGKSLRNGMGRISAANPRCALELRVAISECAAGTLPRTCRFGVAVPIGSEENEVIAWVLPLPRKGSVPAQRRAAVFVREGGEAFSGDLFARRFGVTPAELRILDMLIKGASSDEMSSALSISENTIKTHLKSLFAKTGSSRQADLLRLASTTLAPVAACA